MGLRIPGGNSEYCRGLSGNNNNNNNNNNYNRNCENVIWKWLKRKSEIKEEWECLGKKAHPETPKWCQFQFQNMFTPHALASGVGLPEGRRYQQLHEAKAHASHSISSIFYRLMFMLTLPNRNAYNFYVRFIIFLPKKREKCFGNSCSNMPTGTTYCTSPKELSSPETSAGP